MLTKTKVIVSLAVLIISVIAGSSYVAETQTAKAVQQSTQFEVNVREILSVSITTPSEWVSGHINSFLRNKINVTVTGNSGEGFVASMSTNSDSTELVHEDNMDAIPTLSQDTLGYGYFPVNRWGYSLNDTDAGSDRSVYSALVNVSQTPITLISNADSRTINSKDIYFGAKADMSKSSGTYQGTIVINVVSGTINEDSSNPDYNPTTPTSPATPTASEEVAEYHGAPIGDRTSGTTTYTYSSTDSTNHTRTTTTQVSDGDNRDSYIAYTPPQGVSRTTRSTSTTDNSTDSSSLAMGLAITSGVAAAAGLGAFFLAKSKSNEEDDDETGLSF